MTARVLYLDIETSPLLTYSWGLFNQNMGLNQLVEPSRVLCFAAKWRDEKQTPLYSEWEHGHDGMIQAAHDLLAEASVVVHYNGAKFDIPTLNGEFAKANMPPPEPSRQLDLYKVVKSRFRLTSHKLDFVSKHLGLGGKMQHQGFDLWAGVLAGEAKVQQTMGRYCQRDTSMLQPLHDRLAPWIVNGPNMRLTDDPDGCPNCGGRLVKEGFAYTKLGKYQQFSCTACGSWHRSTRRVDGTQIGQAS